VQVYKKEEGMWARFPLAIVGGIITVAMTRAAQGWMKGVAGFVAAGVVFAICSGITLYVTFFHKKMGDVLIDTESEMRKVVWPTREEVQGSTIVVIATVVILGLAIFGMDWGLGSFCRWIGLY